MSRPCQHLDHFAKINVIALQRGKGGPITGYTAEIRITCRTCNTPFEFIGLGAGWSPVAPMTSADAQELRAPIVPAGAVQAMASPSRVVS